LHLVLFLVLVIMSSSLLAINGYYPWN
jgi:hypothetical protein